MLLKQIFLIDLEKIKRNKLKRVSKQSVKRWTSFFFIQSFPFTYRDTICALHLGESYQSSFTHYRFYLLILSFFLTFRATRNSYLSSSDQQTTVSELNPRITEQFVFCHERFLIDRVTLPRICSGPYVRERRKISYSRPTLLFSSLFFYIARSLNEKYKKLCTQVHFCCALMSTDYK